MYGDGHLIVQQTLDFFATVYAEVGKVQYTGTKFPVYWFPYKRYKISIPLLITNATYNGNCVEFERKKQHNIGFPTFKLPTSTKNL